MNKKTARPLRVYKTYSFDDHDPVIDILRKARDARSIKIGAISELSGVSNTTLYNWFRGKTRKPQFATVVAAARAMGIELAIARLLRGK